MAALKLGSKRLDKALNDLKEGACHLSIRRGGQVKAHYLPMRVLWWKVVPEAGSLWFGLEGDGTLNLEEVHRIELAENDLPGQNYLHFRLADDWVVSLQF